MSKLREQLQEAKAQYRAARYDGDLADELLGARRHGSRPSMRIGWFVPLMGGAIAAMIAVAVWHRSPPVAPVQPRTSPVVIVPPRHAPDRTPDFRKTLNRLPGIHYEPLVDEMRTDMKQAVNQLSGRVDRALEAPLVTGSVQTVRQVGGDLQEIASIAWEQLRPRRGVE